MSKLGMRMAVTMLAVVAAGFFGWRLWGYYMYSPWTRDGRIGADVVGVAPDVSGLVIEIAVANNQMVHKGDVLFRIDPVRFELALAQAEADVQARQAISAEANRERDRALALTTLEVSVETQQSKISAAAVAEANLQLALTARAVAALDLQRSTVRASVDGIVANFQMRPGDYVTRSAPVFAIVDTDSFYAEGYFEETKIPRIQVGDPVRLHLMGDARVLSGTVEGIAGGIANSERVHAGTLLAEIQPTFSWVRLAQRIPVRVHIDTVPAGIRLISGRTVTVEVLERHP